MVIYNIFGYMLNNMLCILHCFVVTKVVHNINVCNITYPNLPDEKFRPLVSLSTFSGLLIGHQKDWPALDQTSFFK